jgi:hypothetical protein
MLTRGPSDPLGFTLDIADTLLAQYRLGADAALYRDAVDYLQPGHDAITRWGLLRSPAEDFAPHKWYYGLLQILPYLQSGAQVLDTERHGGDDIGLLAIRAADGRLAMFFVNDQDSAVDVSLQVIGAAPETFSVTRTDDAAVDRGRWARPHSTIDQDAEMDGTDIPQQRVYWRPPVHR